MQSYLSSRMISEATFAYRVEPTKIARDSVLFKPACLNVIDSMHKIIFESHNMYNVLLSD